MKKFPTISIVIPTFNEEKNIKKCLDSIFRQKYPYSKLEVLVVDDNSTDRTQEIVRQYPTKLLISGKRHGEISKMIGFKAANGEYVMYLDADNELVGNNWFNKMLKPLEENKDIIGVFTWEGAMKTDSALERFLSFDPLQRDSLYQFFSPSIDEVVSQKKTDYWILKYEINKIPPAGRCLYRRAKIMPIIESFEMFLELDFLVLLVKNGFTNFGYSVNSGLYHHHASNVGELLRKRKYNLTKVYYIHAHNKLYQWFNLHNPIDVTKLFLWVVWSNLIIPSVIVGVYKSIKYNDVAGMYEPIINLLVTDMLVFTALTDRRTFSLIK